MLNKSSLQSVSKFTSEFEKAKNKKKEFELGFNVFSLMSATYHRENFHSKIIYSLLNPKGKHNEGRLYLDLFLDFLKEKLNFSVDNANYTNGIYVKDEHTIDNQRRIDILLKSNTHAIIIENKINNAIDMENQLIDYYKYCKNNNLEVDAILYLSLDGIKAPDQTKWDSDNETKSKINSKLKKISAFSINLENDSLYHWLVECEKRSISADNKFIIKHYKQLIKSLRNHIMETTELKKYYEDFILNTKNKEEVKEIEKLVDMHNHLKYYYPEKLKTIIDDEEKLNRYFNDNIIIDETSIVFKNNIAQFNYYLKVSFESNKQCIIRLMDNDKKWQYDDILKNEDAFTSLFDNYDHFWELKKKDFDFVNNFNELIDLVKDVLLKIIDVVSKNQN